MVFGGEQQRPPQRNPLGNLSIRLVPIAMAMIAIGFTAVRGCQEGPFGRKQVVGMNVEQETKLGLQAYQEVLQKSERLNDAHPLVQSVRNVGRRLEAAAVTPEFQQLFQAKVAKFEYAYNVVAENQLNAFCLPGGKVVVYTGIVPVCETEAGLATVMGHEIGHALAHHGAERMARQQMVQIGAQGFSAAIGDMPPEARNKVLGLLGAGANVGLILPFSREHELEADRIGLALMAVAGYDPREASRFWERMTKATSGGGKRPSEILSTHPGPEHRATVLQNLLAEALPLYEKSERQRDRALPSLQAQRPGFRF